MVKQLSKEQYKQMAEDTIRSAKEKGLSSEVLALKTFEVDNHTFEILIEVYDREDQNIDHKYAIYSTVWNNDCCALEPEWEYANSFEELVDRLFEIFNTNFEEDIKKYLSNNNLLNEN
jgi:hypothetical protein